MPPAGENQASVRASEVENGLGSSGCVVLPSPWDQNGQHPIALSNRSFDNLAIVRATREDADTILERLKLMDAGFATDTMNLIASVQAMLNHISPEFAGSADDANSLHVDWLLLFFISRSHAA
jgi:hypothetical protein